MIVSRAWRGLYFLCAWPLCEPGSLPVHLKAANMTTNTARALSALSMAATMAGLLPAHAATVNFETNPVLGTAPSLYVAGPGPQTFVTPEATFSGGVALGFATFFPAILFATIPNVYGTADFGNGLARSLDIAINPAFTTTEVSFVLFNLKTAVDRFPPLGTPHECTLFCPRQPSPLG